MRLLKFIILKEYMYYTIAVIIFGSRGRWRLRLFLTSLFLQHVQYGAVLHWGYSVAIASSDI